MAFQLAATLALAGCSSEVPDLSRNNQTVPGQTSTPSTKTSAAEQDPTDVAEPTEDGQAGWELIELDQPYRYEASGVAMEIIGVAIGDVSQMPADETGFLDEDTATLLVAYVRASNDSGQAVNFYPAQGTAVIAREQSDANLFLGSGVAGNDWQDQVDANGEIVWELTTPPDAAYEAGGFVYTASAPFPADDFSAKLGEEVRLEIVWSP